MDILSKIFFILLVIRSCAGDWKSRFVGFMAVFNKIGVLF